jgi:hypothetical protein
MNVQKFFQIVSLIGKNFFPNLKELLSKPERTCIENKRLNPFPFLALNSTLSPP